MNWVKRYVAAVKSYLPANLKEDVSDELYADLEDQCEDKAEHLGRELNEEEVQSVLLERGHPMTVAAAFQPHKTLVSEELFPIYRQVLKWVIFIIFIVHSVSALAQVMNSVNPNYIRAAWRIIGGTFNAGLMSFAWVTLVFYLLGETISRNMILKGWHPRSLPRVTESGDHISLFESGLELVFQLLFLGWINQFFSINNTQTSTIAVTISDQLQSMAPWINIALVLSIGYSVIKLLFPYWTKRKIVTEWALYAIFYAVLATLYQIDAGMSVIFYDDVGTASSFEILPLWWRNSMVVAAVIFAVDIGFLIRRYLRLK